MAQVIIRNLDPAVVKELKRRAADAELSLEQYLRDMCEREAKPDMSAYFAKRDLLMAKVRKPIDLDDVVGKVRQSRDERARYLYEVSALGEATSDPL